MADEKDNISPPLPKRNQIVQAAFDLFKENGFYATGVDLIMRTANISKRTLYKYFPTKNDLIVAVLEYFQMACQQSLNRILERTDISSKEKILAIFEDAKGWFDDPAFYGCLAVNAMGEFSGKAQDIEDSCKRFKQWELEVLCTLAKDTQALQSDELAYKLFLLLEGMSSAAQVLKTPCPVDVTKMADELIESHLAKKAL
jgi:AcrR family transcriptional regulator